MVEGPRSWRGEIIEHGERRERTAFLGGSSRLYDSEIALTTEAGRLETGASDLVDFALLTSKTAGGFPAKDFSKPRHLKTDLFVICLEE